MAHAITDEEVEREIEQLAAKETTEEGEEE